MTDIHQDEWLQFLWLIHDMEINGVGWRATGRPNTQMHKRNRGTMIGLDFWTKEL